MFNNTWLHEAYDLIILLLQEAIVIGKMQVLGKINFKKMN